MIGRKKSSEILCCPNCGSVDLTLPFVASGFIPDAHANSGIYLCRDCGYQGLPLMFDDLEKFKSFILQNKELKKQK